VAGAFAVGLGDDADPVEPVAQLEPLTQTGALPGGGRRPDAGGGQLAVGERPLEAAGGDGAAAAGRFGALDAGQVVLAHLAVLVGEPVRVRAARQRGVGVGKRDPKVGLDRGRGFGSSAHG
jgi:hypothetical protein